MKHFRSLILFFVLGIFAIPASAQFNTNKPAMMTSLFDRATLSFMSRAGIQNDRVAREAVEQLVHDLKRAGIWQRLNAFYPFVGTTSTSHSINLISTNYTITWYGSSTFTTNGVTGDGVSGHGDTGYDMDEDLRVSAQGIHVYVYWSTNNLSSTNANPATLIGCKTQAGTAEFSLGIVATNKTRFAYGSNPISITNAALWGNLYGQYFSVTNRFLMNQTNLSQGNSPSGAGADRGTISVLCRGNVDNQFCKGTIRAASIGYKMPPAMVSNYFVIVTRFQAALKRNIP